MHKVHHLVERYGCRSSSSSLVCCLLDAEVLVSKLKMFVSVYAIHIIHTESYINDKIPLLLKNTRSRAVSSNMFTEIYVAINNTTSNMLHYC